MSKHIIIENTKSENIEQLPQNLDVYEILQILGKGGYGLVSKVKSKTNNKLYAMKKIDFSLIKQQEEKDLSLNEINIIRSLNSPHIIKYYNSFIVGNCLYVLMEYMDNGDIKGYIEVHKNMNKPIPEPELWELFYQCLAALQCIHNNNLIHRDIKPANLFMTNDKTIKIGDFGVSATRKKENNMTYINSMNLMNTQNIMTNTKNSKEKLRIGTPVYMAPEMFTDEGYGSKIDVYALGITFFDMCFYEHPRELVQKIDPYGNPVLDLKDIPPKFNQKIYSNELIKLIYWMIEKNHKKRPTSTEAFNYVKKIYNRTNRQNSSIDCVYRCLYSFKNLSDYLIKNNNYIRSNIASKPISSSFLYAIEKMNVNNWASELNTLRDILTFNNSGFIDPGIIDPIDLIRFILERIHMETSNNNANPNPYLSTIDNNIIINQQQSLTNYLLNLKKYKSCICDFFFGTIETIKLCLLCKQKKFYYSNFFYITFDIDEAILNGLNLNNNFILNYFLKQNSLCINNISYCCFCKNNSNHQESKLFFSLPYNLIICFKREKENNECLNYPLILDFSTTFIKNTPGKYNLKGIIKYCNVKDTKFYTCIYFDSNCKKWIISDGYCKNFIASPLNHNVGHVVALFYSCLN